MGQYKTSDLPALFLQKSCYIARGTITRISASEQGTSYRWPYLAGCLLRHQCLVCQFTNSWGFRPDAAFSESKGSACWCGYLLDVIVTWIFFINFNTQVLGASNWFKELSSSRYLLGTGILYNYSLAWIELHVLLQLPLMKEANILLQYLGILQAENCRHQRTTWYLIWFCLVGHWCKLTLKAPRKKCIWKCRLLKSSAANNCLALPTN